MHSGRGSEEQIVLLNNLQSGPIFYLVAIIIKLKQYSTNESQNAKVITSSGCCIVIGTYRQWKGVGSSPPHSSESIFDQVHRMIPLISIFQGAVETGLL